MARENVEFGGKFSESTSDFALDGLTKNNFFSMFFFWFEVLTEQRQQIGEYLTTEMK